MVFTVIDKPEARAVDEIPIDAELIKDSVDATLEMRLATSTREEIDNKTQLILGHLNLLLAEELGADLHADVRFLFQEAYRHIDLKHRPNRETTAFAAFSYMRRTAVLTRSFLGAYCQTVTNAQ